MNKLTIDDRCFSEDQNAPLCFDLSAHEFYVLMLSRSNSFHPTQGPNRLMKLNMLANSSHSVEKHRLMKL